MLRSEIIIFHTHILFYIYLVRKKKHGIHFLKLVLLARLFYGCTTNATFIDSLYISFGTIYNGISGRRLWLVAKHLGSDCFPKRNEQIQKNYPFFYH